MTDTPGDVRAALDGHKSLEPRGDHWTVTTTVFEGTVAVRGGETPRYTASVEVPTLDAATADEVSPAVAEDWLRTLRRRLRDAPQATRADVELDSATVSADGDTVRIEYVFAWDGPTSAADIATAFVEYVEGTYVEGVVPGYEYEPPVSDLLARASQGEKGGTPL